MYLTSNDTHNTVLSFFNYTATTEIYTLSLHDALPICLRHRSKVEIQQREDDQQRHRDDPGEPRLGPLQVAKLTRPFQAVDRKSTRLNSSHPSISYAVFCLKKKKI